jgi:hypothetical protein
MSKLLACLALLYCCCACDDRQPADLSTVEQAALAHIERTPHLEVFAVQRLGEHELIVATRQGDASVRYHIDSSNPDAAPHEMVQRLPSTGLRYTYDRSKPRGTFHAAR